MDKATFIHIFNKVEVLKDFCLISSKRNRQRNFTEGEVTASYFGDQTIFVNWYDSLSANGRDVFNILCAIAETSPNGTSAITRIDNSCKPMLRFDENAKQYIERNVNKYVH